MDIRKDSIDFIINADFNQLFTEPEFIASQIFNKEEIEVQISSLINNGMQTNFTDGDITIQPSLRRVRFAVKDYDGFDRFIQIVKKYVELSNPPRINSFGLNFALESNVDDFSEEFSKLYDIGKISSQLASIIKCKLSRTIQLPGKSYLINYDIFVHENKTLIKANCHFDARQNKLQDNVDKLSNVLEETKLFFEAVYEE